MSIKASAYFLGNAGRRLFGCYHEPSPERFQERGVVLCHPVGDEYILAHRSFRRMATLLARAGFPVLRFDYGGCGDSEGELDGLTLSDWKEDVAEAIRELLWRAATPRVCVVGLRLGAAIGLDASATIDEVDAAVLWEPITSGQNYLSDVKLRHQTELRERKLDGLDSGNGAEEQLGYAYSARMLSEIASIDLLATRAAPGDALVLSCDEDPNFAELATLLQAGGARCKHQRVQGTQFWHQDLDRTPVPAKALDTIVRWISELPS